MTFSEWYAATIEPTLPTDVPEPIRTNARESMAACWNAALDAVLAEAGYERVASGGIVVGIYKVGEPQMDGLRVPISRFEFERQRLRQ